LAVTAALFLAAAAAATATATSPFSCWCATAAATTLVLLLLLLLLLLPYCRWLLAADCCLLATIAAGCWRLAMCSSTL